MVRSTQDIDQWFILRLHHKSLLQIKQNGGSYLSLIFTLPIAGFNSRSANGWIIPFKTNLCTSPVTNNIKGSDVRGVFRGGGYWGLAPPLNQWNLFACPTGAETPPERKKFKPPRPWTHSWIRPCLTLPFQLTLLGLGSC